MKIGILTYHRPCNFGANLQAFASCSYLQSVGHEAKVLDFVRPVDISYSKTVPALQQEAHRQFVDTRLPLTRQATTPEELCDIAAEEQFDLIIIGADAVWRAPEDDSIFFAKWLFEDGRISSIPVCSISAAHMGMGFCKLSENKKEDIKRCLEQFKLITVRDEWTCHVINRDIFDGVEQNIYLNPDPVFNLSKYVGNETWENRGLEQGKYILMTLPKNWCKEGKKRPFRKLWFWRFKRLVNKAGYQLVEFPVPEGKSGMKFDACIDFPIDPMQWFLFIKNAKAFIGLRFHAIVSSISCGTAFYSIDNYGDKSSHRLHLDIIGKHKEARALDVHSKIRNLLKDSPFEDHRTGMNLEWESPTNVINKLLKSDIKDIDNFKKKQLEIFQHNMTEILKS